MTIVNAQKENTDKVYDDFDVVNNTQKTNLMVRKHYDNFCGGYGNLYKGLKPVRYNDPLEFRLAPLLVKEKTIDGYFKHISHNIRMGKKAIYIVCRDLSDAENNLDKNQFAKLVNELDLSSATVRKYRIVGQNIRLQELFYTGKMPVKWTTMYYVTTLSEGDFDKVKTQIKEDTPVKKINDWIGKKGKSLPPNPFVKSATILVNKTKMNVAEYSNLIADFKALVQKNKKVCKIEVNDDAKEIIKKLVEKKNEEKSKKKSQKRKSKKITSKD